MNTGTAPHGVNRRIVLQARPTGTPVPADFLLQEVPIPRPAEGQLLLKNLYLSLDPYMRGRMNEGPSYAPAVELGAVMVGGTVSEVIESRHPRFKPGDRVVTQGGWQTHTLSDGTGLGLLPADMTHISLALSLLGMPGFTAWYGLLRIGEPRAGDTVVVASATGTVGAVVGQLAKRKGSRAIGIAGGAEKCRIAVEELGFDACIDHRSPDFAGQLAAVTPEGIDVYFENVGGAVFDAVLPRLNIGARVPLCGLIAQYNSNGLYPGPDRLPRVMGQLLARRIKIQGFIISDHYADDYANFMREMSAEVAHGHIRVRENVLQGLSQAPQGLIDLLDSRFTGKVVVQLTD